MGIVSKNYFVFLSDITQAPDTLNATGILNTPANSTMGKYLTGQTKKKLKSQTTF